MVSNLIPRLRFPGFVGEWKEKSLEELGFLTAGGTPSTTNPDFWGGDINWLQSGAVQNYIVTERAVVRTITKLGLQNCSAHLIRPNSVLIAITGATCANVGYLTFESAANQSVVSLEPNTDNNAMFLYQKLLTERAKILTYKGGSAQSGVTLNALKKMKILVPPTLDEQDMIASCLSEMDNMITTQRQKVESLKAHKEGLIQHLFPQKGETVPRLRFPGFRGDWEERLLNDCFQERNEQFPENNEYPLMAFIAGKGVAHKGDRYDRSALVKDATNKKYKRTEFGDFIYSSNNLETGSIGLNYFGKACISPVYSIFKTKGQNSAVFLGTLLTQKSFISEMVKFRQGVVYGQWKIPEKEFLRIKIRVPSIQEQQKIAKCLMTLNDVIVAENEKAEMLKGLKKGLLQQLFPQPIK